jgi:hypothetical protein
METTTRSLSDKQLEARRKGAAASKEKWRKIHEAEQVKREADRAYEEAAQAQTAPVRTNQNDLIESYINSLIDNRLSEMLPNISPNPSNSGSSVISNMSNALLPLALPIALKFLPDLAGIVQKKFSGLTPSEPPSTGLRGTNELQFYSAVSR